MRRVSLRPILEQLFRENNISESIDCVLTALLSVDSADCILVTLPIVY